MNDTSPLPEDPRDETTPERAAGEIELTPRTRIGARATVLAGLALGSAAAVGLTSIPTVTSLHYGG